MQVEVGRLPDECPACGIRIGTLWISVVRGEQHDSALYLCGNKLRWDVRKGEAVPEFPPGGMPACRGAYYAAIETRGKVAAMKEAIGD